MVTHSSLLTLKLDLTEQRKRVPSRRMLLCLSDTEQRMQRCVAWVDPKEAFPLHVLTEAWTVRSFAIVIHSLHQGLSLLLAKQSLLLTQSENLNPLQDWENCDC